MIQTVALRSNRAYGGRIPPAPVGHLLTVVPKVVRGCVSMAYQRRSKSLGTPSSWLVAASDVRVVEVKADHDTIVRFDAPPLGEAAKELYTQGELWSTRPDPEDTAFDLLGDVLKDVSSENEDSERFDQDLLRSLAAFKQVLNGSYHEMLVSGGRYSVDAPAVMDKATIAAAKTLCEKTPAQTRVRLVGVLDAVRISTQTFALKLDDGHEVQGVFGQGDFDGVLELLKAKQRVLVRGDASYRPSGQLLLIDAEEVSAGEGQSPIWSRVPQAAEGRLNRPSLHRRQTKSSGLAAIVGKWPGHETDEEIAEALRALR
ncbi:MAG: hypothetical protein ABFE16_14040 [Armatimonadia bacterium]